MKISDSNIQLVSSHLNIEKHEERESLVAWQRGRGRVEEEARGENSKGLKKMALAMQKESTTVSLSTEVLRNRPVKVQAVPVRPEDKTITDLNLRILKAMIEKFTGKKFRSFDPMMFSETGQEQAQNVAPDGQQVVPVESESVGWGLAYDHYESHYEYEATSFSAQGVITTEDGQEITFSAELNMSREYMSHEEFHLRAGDALKDPLVINFDGPAANLTQRDFSFDLDADGQKDQISFVRPGSGFLSYDKNNDGIINNGSELFGPATGNGFSELAEFDADENGWIDENDLIYDKLRIWTKNEAGEDQLFALGAKNVGAIYLGSVSTPFELTDQNNEMLGEVRSSGIFLGDDGSVGTVQQLDLVV